MDYNKERQRANYFTPLEQEVLIAAYSDYKHVFSKKSNTAAAAKEREMAWQKIADRVNACNPGSVKRTWQQIKVKYKNIIQTANRKKVEARKTGCGSPPAPFTLAEDLALSENKRRPFMEDIPGGSSSEPPTPQDASAYINMSGVLQLEDIPPIDEDDKETLSALRIETRVEETSRVSHSGSPEEVPMSSTEQHRTIPVKDLYKVHMEKQIQKCDLQMDHIQVQIEQSQLQIKKTKIEIEILEHQLSELKNKRQ